MGCVLGDSAHLHFPLGCVEFKHTSGSPPESQVHSMGKALLSAQIAQNHPQRVSGPQERGDATTGT